MSPAVILGQQPSLKAFFFRGELPAVFLTQFCVHTWEALDDL